MISKPFNRKNIRTIFQHWNYTLCNESVIVSVLDFQWKGSKIKPHQVIINCQCQCQTWKMADIDYLLKRKREENSTIKNKVKTKQRVLHPCQILCKWDMHRKKVKKTDNKNIARASINLVVNLVGTETSIQFSWKQSNDFSFITLVLMRKSSSFSAM